MSAPAIEFSHTLAVKPRSIKEPRGKVQPFKKAVLPTKSKRVTPKASAEGDVFETNVPEDLSAAERMRDDIIEQGVDKFKKSDIGLIKDYYRRLTGGENDPVPGLSRDKLSKLILQRLGIPQS